MAGTTSPKLDLVLLHEISGGTFAQLYLAESRAGGIDRMVAVKILRDQWSAHDEILRRTRDEARLLARLRHKNIVRVEDLTTLDGRLAIIMEFVEGVDIKQLAELFHARGERLPARVALQIAAATASALEAAWQRVPLGLDEPLHVVHRDIKPSNVMLSAEGEVKVLDFGTARSTQAMRSAQTGAIRFGSLKYMSPERREGDRGIHVADVYATGLVLLELLRGAWMQLLPLDPDAHDAAVQAAVDELEDFALPSPAWDEALRQLLAQVLSADPSLRPDAEQLAHTLRTYADHAAGPTLESFAREFVEPVVRTQTTPKTDAGAFTGTRIFLDESEPPEEAGAQPGPASEFGDEEVTRVGGPNAASAMTPAPRRSHLTVVPDSASDPAPAARPPQAAPVEQPSVPTPGLPVLSGTREAPRAAPPAPVHDPGEATLHAQPAFNRRHLTQVPDEVHAVEPPSPPAATYDFDAKQTPPPPQARRPFPWMVVAALGAAFLAVVSVAGAVVFWWRSSPADTLPYDVRPVVETNGADAEAAGSAGGATVEVAFGVPVQWARLESGGTTALQGKGALSGSVPAGTYTLVVKRVGRPALKARLDVASSGMRLACADQADGMNCAGDAAVPLRP